MCFQIIFPLPLGNFSSNIKQTNTYVDNKEAKIHKKHQKRMSRGQKYEAI